MTNPILGNVAKETTTTQGTGTYTLLGPATTQFQDIVSACGTGSEVLYKVFDSTNFEIGIGVITDGGGGSDTLSRVVILESTNADAAVNWGAGTRTVIVGASAEILNQAFRAATHNFASDANVTLASKVYFARTIKLTDTSVVLTTGRNVVVPAYEFVWLVRNSTAQTLTVKTSAGTGIAVSPGQSRWVRGDGTNVVNADDEFGALKTGALTSTVLNSDGVSIASATTTDIGAAAGNDVTITGTTTITGFGTIKAGVFRLVKFSGALTLTHNATSLIIPGGANVTTAAGDTCIAVSLGSGNWRIYAYVRATGKALVETSQGLNLLTPVTLTNQTSVDFTIPAGAKMVWLSLAGASSNGTSLWLIQLGDAGGIENTGYKSTCSSVAAGVATSSSTAGFLVLRTIAGTDDVNGVVTLTRIDSSNQWAQSANLTRNTSEMGFSAGSKQTSQELTTVRLTTVNGTDQFDAGTVNVSWM